MGLTFADCACFTQMLFSIIRILQVFEFSLNYLNGSIIFLSFRVFGHFEQPLFFELCKHIVTKSVPKGKVLFRPGAVSFWH